MMRVLIAVIGVAVFVAVLGTAYIWMVFGSIQCRGVSEYERVESMHIEVRRERVRELVELVRRYSRDRNMTFAHGAYGTGMTLIESCNRTLDAGIANPFNPNVFSVHLSRNTDRTLGAYADLASPLKDELRRRFREVPQSESGEWAGP
jgi:hypothetical protein